MTSLPDTNHETTISLRKMGGGTTAVIKFNGNPTKDILLEKEKILHSSLMADGLRLKTMGCLLSHLNNLGQTWSFAIPVCSNTLQAHS